MTAGLANHLWQSTLFALAAAALVAALRGNRAPIRHGIWVIASVKWLVPFAWLMAAGSAVTGMLPETGVGAVALRTQPALSAAILQLTEPFPAVESAGPISSAVSNGWLETAIVAVWACGLLAMAATRLRGWLRVRSAIRHSAPLDVGLRDARMHVRSAPGLLEPGVVGIWQPVLLMPAGIEQQLEPAQLQSVVAHELCHVRRRDNLTAAVHIVVESVFWFHPLVWWIGARLIEERERACDEDVLGRGAHPRDYAEGILRVCRLYVESPIACLSGVTGSNLKRRIEDIMMHRIGRSLSVTRKVMLVTAAALALAAPVAVGAMAPPVRAQSAPPGAAAGAQSPTVGGDLTSVFKVMRDVGATAGDRERLIGKVYSGIVTVGAVRIHPKGAIVVATPAGTGAARDKAPAIGLGFHARADDEKLQQLRKDKDTRMRGTLTRIWTEGHIVWAEFSDLVIGG